LKSLVECLNSQANNNIGVKLAGNAGGKGHEIKIS
jgi:hypothetical protein